MNEENHVGLHDAFYSYGTGEDVNEFLRGLKNYFRAHKEENIQRGMQTLSGQEAEHYRPICRQYNAEPDKFVDARAALIKAYAENYDTMTDGMANELITRSFSLQKQRDALYEKFRKGFATALSPRRLAGFYQIEHQLHLLIELQVAMQTPKMKWW